MMKAKELIKKLGGINEAAKVLQVKAETLFSWVSGITSPAKGQVECYRDAAALRKGEIKIKCRNCGEIRETVNGCMPLCCQNCGDRYFKLEVKG